MGTISSVHDGEKFTVDDLIGAPTWIAEKVIKNLDGAMISEAIFRNEGESELVVAYREAAQAFLSEDAEDVAEFGEIPVADIGRGDLKFVTGNKTALGVRISYEMKKFNKIGQVNRQITALQNTMVRSDVRASLRTFAAAGVDEVPVSSPWPTTGSSPIDDVFDAIEAIEDAHLEDDPDANLGYVPDIMIAHPRTVTMLTRNAEYQKLFIGNLADQNPVYRGTLPTTIAGLRVLTSRFADPGQVIIAESGVVGFRTDPIPLEMTPLYPEGGSEQHGGSNMSYRADAFRTRITATDAPKAARILTGVRG
ncbi:MULTISPECIES: phage major capsid protein [unclassified Dietzia]|uniref:phage major capsid protein n=1 Tax=unclassified Dietzia TaxID=2617939 RepID=UPI0015F8FBBC|nr:MULTISPECIES: hypothetical protein [unclassified Dietzia]MBB1022959.1 hypothetical protein [Dietzia sp. DQ12-76]MBB1026465.1 hypothetical protein [Dietzia sp. DQ11-38-2]